MKKFQFLFIGSCSINKADMYIIQCELSTHDIINLGESLTQYVEANTTLTVL
jgi:hypothetical protein